MILLIVKKGSYIKIKQHVRLDILLQNRKSLQKQVVRINLTIKKLLNKDAPLTERILTLFYEEGITTTSKLTSLSTAIARIVLAIKGAFRGGQSVSDSYLPKHEGNLKK